MRYKEVKTIVLANLIPILFIGQGIIEPFLFESNVIGRNVFIASFFLTFIGEIGLFTQSLSFLVDHIKNVKKARAFLLMTTSLLYLLIGILVLFPITPLTFVVILISFFGSYLAGTYESLFIYLTYKGKLDEKEYVTMSQINEGRVFLGWLLISSLSFLVGVYGSSVISLFFIVSSIYYPVSHYFMLNFDVGERLNHSRLKLTKEALSKYVNLLKGNKRFFYVVFAGIFIFSLITEQSMYFYGVFRNFPDLYQAYSIYTFTVMMCYALSIFTVRRVIRKINKVSTYFLFFFYSFPLYVVVILISLFHLSPFFFFLGLVFTRYNMSVLSYYESMVNYSSVPSEIVGYASSISSLISIGMELFTSIFIAGYLIEYYGTLTSASIIIGVSLPLISLLYFKTRKISE